jgi:hypothetical protein
VIEQRSVRKDAAGDWLQCHERNPKVVGPKHREQLGDLVDRRRRGDKAAVERELGQQSVICGLCGFGMALHGIERVNIGNDGIRL